jgi:hypothetical protein
VYRRLIHLAWARLPGCADNSLERSSSFARNVIASSSWFSVMRHMMPVAVGKVGPAWARPHRPNAPTCRRQRAFASQLGILLRWSSINSWRSRPCRTSLPYEPICVAVSGPCFVRRRRTKRWVLATVAAFCGCSNPGATASTEERANSMLAKTFMARERQWKRSPKRIAHTRTCASLDGREKAI